MKIVIYKNNGAVWQEYERKGQTFVTTDTGSTFGQSDFVTTELPIAIEELIKHEDETAREEG